MHIQSACNLGQSGKSRLTIAFRFLVNHGYQSLLFLHHARLYFIHGALELKRLHRDTDAVQLFLQHFAVLLYLEFK
jgi:hypothetical protein